MWRRPGESVFERTDHELESTNKWKYNLPNNETKNT